MVETDLAPDHASTSQYAAVTTILSSHKHARTCIAEKSAAKHSNQSIATSRGAAASWNQQQQLAERAPNRHARDQAETQWQRQRQRKRQQRNSPTTWRTRRGTRQKKQRSGQQATGRAQREKHDASKLVNMRSCRQHQSNQQRQQRQASMRCQRRQPQQSCWAETASQPQNAMRQREVGAPRKCAEYYSR